MSKKKIILIVVGVLFVLGIIGSQLKKNGSSSNQASTNQNKVTKEVSNTKATDSPKPTSKPKATATPEPTEPSMTMGQKNALKQAKNYLSFTAFSRSGLIEQLEFEGYSTEDATFAVDNCGANWNEQAALKAKSYLDFMAFSKDGLIDQLEFEGFTSEQAKYGVKAVGY